jgi:hypothetical protein
MPKFTQNCLSHIIVENTKRYWQQIQDELKDGSVEIETWSMEPRSGHFYARVASDRVFIEGKGIKGIRTITFSEFERVAAFYNDYVDEVPGVRQKLRNAGGYNTTYILTLLHRVLGQSEPPLREPVKEPERDTSLRLKYLPVRRRR